MELFKHQKEAVEFIKEIGDCALHHDMGLGKTRTMLEVYRFARSKKDAKMLVICPLSLINAAWGEDIAKFTPYTYQDMHKTKKPDTTKDIFIINYEAMLNRNVYLTICQLLNQFPFVGVLDESSKIKNHKAKTTKLILELSDLFWRRFTMSATPAPNSEMEYWPQFAFLNKNILGKSFYKFRNEYFHLGRGNQIIEQGSFMTKTQAAEIFKKGFKYEITPANKQRLLNAIAPYCHIAKKELCLDLPESMDEIRLIKMGIKQKSIYKEMANYFICEILGQDIAARQAITKLMKLRQITSGFVINDESIPVEIGENPKLKELTELLEQLGEKQCIIWGQFHHEIKKIKDILGDKAVTLYGLTDNREQSIKDFISGKAQYLIAHPRSAGHGLTFVNCSTQIFFSLDYSGEYHEQAKGRIHRAGQKNKCLYIYLLCEGSIDESIFRVLRDKKNESEILSDMLRQRDRTKKKSISDDQERLSFSMGLEDQRPND